MKKADKPLLMSWESVSLNIEIKSCLYNVHVGGTVDRSRGNWKRFLACVLWAIDLELSGMLTLTVGH